MGKTFSENQLQRFKTNNLQYDKTQLNATEKILI